MVQIRLPQYFLYRSRSVAVNTPACHAGDRGFDSRRDRHYYYGSVAQLVEQWIEAPCVGGSIPSRAIYIFWKGSEEAKRGGL